jgi:Uma2 family endonuclease
MPDEEPMAFSDLLVEAAERDGYKVEWLSGKIVMQTSASAYHSLIVSNTVKQIPDDRLWALTDMIVGEPGIHRGPQPDIVLIPAGALHEDENPIRKDLVVAVFEVVSESTRGEDLVGKPRIYADMMIPVYVIIDQKDRSVHVCSEPEDGGYTRRTVSSFGKPYMLPEPAGITIETERYP